MMSVLEAAKASAQSKQLTIWREIRARLSATRVEPQWLPSNHRRRQRRLHCLLMAELLRDQISAMHNRWPAN